VADAQSCPLGGKPYLSIVRTTILVATVALTAACGGAPFETISPLAEAGPSVALNNVGQGLDAGGAVDAPAASHDGGTAESEASAESGASQDAAQDAAQDVAVHDAAPETSGCPVGQTSCNALCVDTLVDTDNCGDCGLRCPGDNWCSSGTCTPEESGTIIVAEAGAPETGAGVGPNHCAVPVATSSTGAFATPSTCANESPQGYCDLGATLSGCVVTGNTPNGSAFGPVGTNVPQCNGSPDEYPCCLLSVVGANSMDCACYSCSN
jgi:hypothetical protein